MWFVNFVLLYYLSWHLGFLSAALVLLLLKLFGI